jgi:hypothetical protein
LTVSFANQDSSRRLGCPHHQEKVSLPMNFSLEPLKVFSYCRVKEICPPSPQNPACRRKLAYNGMSLCMPGQRSPHCSLSPIRPRHATTTYSQTYLPASRQASLLVPETANGWWVVTRLTHNFLMFGIRLLSSSIRSASRQLIIRLKTLYFFSDFIQLSFPVFLFFFVSDTPQPYLTTILS